MAEKIRVHEVQHANIKQRVNLIDAIKIDPQSTLVLLIDALNLNC